MAGLAASQVVNHPAYKNIVWDLKPNFEGVCESVRESGSKCNIAYEVHGKGPRKLLLVVGLGTFKWFWQRQCRDFGHNRSSEYSCLIFDLRGMGDSDKPWMKYSMEMFAKDAVNVASHIGWTRERELHVVGVSMGGMIAQEIALLIPERIASLTLCSTGPRLINTTGWLDSWRQRIATLIPKSLDQKLSDMKAMLLGDEYANGPDTPEGAEEGAPLFPTGGDRWIAEAAYTYRSPQYTGFNWFLQALAIPGWGKTDEELAQIGDRVGRKRIQVVHGNVDTAISMAHSETLVEGMGGSGEDRVKLVLIEGCGHIPPIEKQAEFAQAIRDLVERMQDLSDEQATC